MHADSCIGLQVVGAIINACWLLTEDSPDWNFEHFDLNFDKTIHFDTDMFNNSTHFSTTNSLYNIFLHTLDNTLDNTTLTNKNLHADSCITGCRGNY